MDDVYCMHAQHVQWRGPQRKKELINSQGAIFGRNFVRNKNNIHNFLRIKANHSLVMVIFF